MSDTPNVITTPGCAIIKVYGDPAPQGSKKHVGGGRMVESSAKLKPWREAVKWACIEAKVETIPGPVSVEITFTMRKPLSAPKRRRTYPDRKPDIDKCARAVNDALVQANVIEDDARIVHQVVAKVFPKEHEKALDHPGALIVVRRITDALAYICGIQEKSEGDTW
jgi:Holliday junction resolvase RusA-like endonuclease